jgi:hypothetical protein
MQWLESPLQLRGHMFKPFVTYFFHPQMKWIKKKSQGKKGFKLLPKEQPCSQRSKA